ncbi:MAG: primosomal protein N' [Pseudomonadota bacterium]
MPPPTGLQAQIPLLRVAVPTPLRRYFDYLAPADTSSPLPPAPGYRVRVPFGRGRDGVVGVVVEHPTQTEVPRGRLKPVAAVLDEKPLLDSATVQLLRWAAEYYHHAPGEVFAAALPGPLRRGDTVSTHEPGWRITEAGLSQDPSALGRRAPRQASLLGWLANCPDHLAPQHALEDALAPGWRDVARRLRERGWLEAVSIAPTAPVVAGEDIPAPVQLNEEQAAAVAQIRDSLGEFQAWLLHGVTGSGKTEVYLRLIQETLSAGRQALVLVPEIGLTPQLVDRLRSRLATPIAVLHSGLADGARARAWLAAREGQAGVVLGTRSGIFAPLANPGLIVVDEEHDASFKQQDGFRYHARDLAVYRARQLGVPVVLGTATPSFETLQNVHQGRYRTARLTRRAGAGVPPSVRLIDLRRDTPAPEAGGLSNTLIARMRSHLAEGSQVLLFLNRRGYAPVWMCLDCGWQATCDRCDARLTLHRYDQRLICHHCGHERRVQTRCPDCKQEDSPRPIGAGTEQVEQALAHTFPGVAVARIDRDSTRRKGELEQRLEAIRSGETRILIGTQMLTKGHDFPGVTLVGVINADGGLYSSDFRAPERLAQLTVQVAGRAGRARSGGEVLVQTAFPDHPLLATLLQEGYDGFARDACEERAEAGWPPFQSLTLLRAEAVEASRAIHFLHEVAALAGPLLRLDAGLTLLGPAPATMERRAGRYRAQLLLRAPRRAPLQTLLSHLLPQVDALPAARRVRWSVDVDPVDLD